MEIRSACEADGFEAPAKGSGLAKHEDGQDEGDERSAEKADDTPQKACPEIPDFFEAYVLEVTDVVVNRLINHFLGVLHSIAFEFYGQCLGGFTDVVRGFRGVAHVPFLLKVTDEGDGEDTECGKENEIESYGEQDCDGTGYAFVSQEVEKRETDGGDKKCDEDGQEEILSRLQPGDDDDEGAYHQQGFASLHFTLFAISRHPLQI